MGGRTGTSIRIITGSDIDVSKNKNLQEAITTKSSGAVANAALAAISTSNPTIGAIYAAYKISKWAYKTYNYVSEVKTKEEAIKIMTEKVTERAVSEVKDYLVRNVVTHGWNSIEEKSKIDIPDKFDGLIIAATLKTIMELME